MRGQLNSTRTIPIQIYWFAVIVCLVALLAIFSLPNIEYCSANAAAVVAKSDALNCFEFWLNRYQTLLSGILALVSAGIAFYAVYMQTRQTKIFNDIQARRKEDGITAVAPFALSLLTDYAFDCMAAIIDARDQVNKHLTHPNFNIPQFPTQTINILRDYVEFGDKDTAKSGAVLLYALQIQQARINSVKEKVLPTSVGLYSDIELQDAMFDALDISAQVSALFGPIRKDYRAREFYITGMYNDLMVRGIEISDWPRVKFKIEAFERAQKQSDSL